MGAIGGPCNGHLSLSQDAFVEGSVVGQVNSSPRTLQTCAVCPGQNALIIGPTSRLAEDNGRVQKYT